MSKKAVILLSGGLDSATVLASARADGYDCYCLSFSYGQKQIAEVGYAKQLALGKVYYKLGDCERATDLLQQVMDQYPKKSAAKLAGNYLRESVNCDN